MNTAPLETLYPVVETFHSLQGEGHHSGRSAFFIRLGGCTVGCSWCDTKHSWPLAQHPLQRVGDLAGEAQSATSAGASFVVITGGEPLHHDLGPLCAALEPLPLHLETSGVDALSGRFSWITLSPKPHRPPRAQLLGACHELKVVINDPTDLAFAMAMAEAAQGQRACGAAPVLLLQPAWNNPSAVDLSIEHVRRHRQWRLSLQTHKWLQIR